MEKIPFSEVSETHDIVLGRRGWCDKADFFKHTVRKWAPHYMKAKPIRKKDILDMAYTDIIDHGYRFLVQDGNGPELEGTNYIPVTDVKKIKTRIQRSMQENIRFDLSTSVRPRGLLPHPERQVSIAIAPTLSRDLLAELNSTQAMFPVPGNPVNVPELERSRTPALLRRNSSSFRSISECSLVEDILGLLQEPQIAEPSNHDCANADSNAPRSDLLTWPEMYLQTQTSDCIDVMSQLTEFTSMPQTSEKETHLVPSRASSVKVTARLDTTASAVTATTGCPPLRSNQRDEDNWSYGQSLDSRRQRAVYYSKGDAPGLASISCTASHGKLSTNSTQKTRVTEDGCGDEGVVDEPTSLTESDHVVTDYFQERSRGVSIEQPNSSNNPKFMLHALHQERLRSNAQRLEKLERMFQNLERVYQDLRSQLTDRERENRDIRERVVVLEYRIAQGETGQKRGTGL